MRVRAALFVFACLTAPAPAEAVAPQAVLAYSGGFLPSEVIVVQGGSLTFGNADATGLLHDVTSTDRKPNGQPLFRSATIGVGVSDVAGVASLAPSVYPFYCSVHEWMIGNVTVVGA